MPSAILSPVDVNMSATRFLCGSGLLGAVTMLAACGSSATAPAAPDPTLAMRAACASYLAAAVTAADSVAARGRVVYDWANRAAVQCSQVD